MASKMALMSVSRRAAKLLQSTAACTSTFQVTDRLSSRPPATTVGPKPGHFPLGSRESRAAASALIQERCRTTPPPWGTLNLSFLSVEQARELYAKVTALPGGHQIGTPWFPIRWPDGFNPGYDPTEAGGADPPGAPGGDL